MVGKENKFFVMTSETIRLLANGSPVSTQNGDGAVKVEQAAACL